MAFVDDVPRECEELGLYPVQDNENVLLIVPNDQGVFQFTQKIKGKKLVSDAQIYVDLKRLSGRAGEQANVLRDRYCSSGKFRHA
jgi:hypothetical protein